MSKKQPWTIDVYETGKGEKPAWAFIAGLGGRDKAEAVALVKLLEECGNLLRRPHSGFYIFLPKQVAVILDGEIKERRPTEDLGADEVYRNEVLRRGKA